jgi:hypothetical protein
MGRHAEGDRPLSGAARQARYRARLALSMPPGPAGDGRSAVRPRKTTRVQRWHAAVGELLALRAAYAAWLEALPEATRDGPTGEALQAIAELDLEEIIAIQPPRGFGRDG